MTESINLAPAVSGIVFGHAVPRALCALGLLSALGVLIALAWDWLRRAGA